VLHRSLERTKALVEAGERSSERLIEAAKQEFRTEPGVRLDYFEIVDPETLEPAGKIENPVLVAVAAYVGSTRLIDNLVLRP
jgi:pantothenate synthetase